VALGGCPPRAPTDPYVLALEHTVLQPTDSPPAKAPEAFRTSYGDIRWNLDVFRMFPSIESAGRRFASLHRVLRGEFPCFDGTIKALRLPAAPPAALRCLRLAVPRLHSFSSLLLRTSAPPEAWSWSSGGSCRDAPRKRQELPSSWGTPIVRLPMFSRLRRDWTRQTITARQRGPWYPKSKGSHERFFEAQ
jgi:hypothetical protein